MTKDPVCGMKLDENNTKAQAQYHGQKYSFCSDECRQKFEQSPEQLYAGDCGVAPAKG